MITIEIGKNEQNQRLDKFLRKYMENAPLSFIYKVIRKDIKVNGKRAKENTVLQLGDLLTLYISEDELETFRRKPTVTGVKKQFSVAYEDENLLAAIKPYGLLTHGDRYEKKNHLTNQVIDYLIEKGEYVPRLEKSFVPAPVNRLDRNTTGLVLFGKNSRALQELNEMIRHKEQVRKFYLTIVSGTMGKPLHLRGRMMKDERINRVRVGALSEEGKEMETIAEPLLTGIYGDRSYTLARVEIITGRTHQIRAQLAQAGYPVIGDAKYGNRRVNQQLKSSLGLTAQLLHAYALSFENCGGLFAYLSGKEIVAELPETFAGIKRQIFEQHELRRGNIK